MAGKKNITLSQCKAALKKFHGAVPLAARYLKIAPQTLGKRIAAHEDLRVFIRDLDAGLIAHAKSNVADAVRKKDMTTSRWLLERKDPDYANRSKVESKLADSDLEALVGALTGGDPEKLRAAKAALDPSQT